MAGEKATPDYCFPNTLFDLTVLEYIVKQEPDAARARYFLGNLYYDKKRSDDGDSSVGNIRKAGCFIHRRPS
ncbi:tetratricopeptide repeat protein [Paenibacillus prosopidis]|uniref:tetratricopeptide repeat protein n=1 Tax=Paenibacillus prosopidis TaxID=630520 RepID=UPI0011C06710|nr:tetratricopeptide repeat protein [Paenibacillus prosopidis]